MVRFDRAAGPKAAGYVQLTEMMSSEEMAERCGKRRGEMKIDCPHRKGIVFLLGVFGVATILGCAGQRPFAPPSNSEVVPVIAEVAGVERLNDIAPQPPFAKTDTLVFRVNFRLSNPNPVLAKVEDLYFEVKAEDGTPDQTIVLTGSMPGGFIPAKGEMMWSWTEPYIYGGVLGSYILRGLGGAEGTKGAAQMLEAFWKDLGADKRKFSIEGKIASSLPEFPNLGIAHQRFHAEFTIPKL